MDFGPAPKRPRGESFVPMINVVFLLLVFFLMTAQIAPPEPFEVTRPKSARGVEPDAEPVLYVGKHDTLWFRDTTGEDAYGALAPFAADGAALQLRIDATLDGDTLARVMRRLAALGFASVEVVVDKT